MTGVKTAVSLINPANRQEGFRQTLPQPSLLDHAPTGLG